MALNRGLGFGERVDRVCGGYLFRVARKVSRSGRVPVFRFSTFTPYRSAKRTTSCPTMA